MPNEFPGDADTASPAATLNEPDTVLGTLYLTQDSQQSKGLASLFDGPGSQVSGALSGHDHTVVTGQVRNPGLSNSEPVLSSVH